MRRFWHRPHSLRIRRALFQLHLWTGLLAGAYILVMSLSGSAVVFRREIAKAQYPRSVVVVPAGERLGDAQIGELARSRLRRVSVDRIEVLHAPPDHAVEVWMYAGRNRIERLVDPYTGKNYGDTIEREPDFLAWLVSLHDELTLGDTGRVLNGLGALALSLVCITGAVIWWPGASRWRQSVLLRRHGDWHSRIWNLHSVLGLWMLLFIVVWAVSGIYFAWPDLFSSRSRAVDEAMDWMVRVHFGRTFGPVVEVIWAVLGLVPAAMFATGLAIWWKRVVRRNRSPGREVASHGIAPANQTPGLK